MSNRNPLEVCKKQVIRAGITAFKIKHLTSTADVSQYAYEELKKCTSPEFMDLIWRDWVRRIIVNMRWEDDDRPEQIDFFKDLDLQFTIRRPKTEGGSYQVALGAMALPDITAVKRQKEVNIAAAQLALDHFNKACAEVVPLLEQNPDWVWRDAVDHLQQRRSDGG